MGERLYIIGNGFDMHHGIKSSYKDFGKYLKAIDSETYDLMTDFLPSYGADDWSDSGHHDYQYEVDRVVEALSRTLLSHFSDWIRQLAIPTSKGIEKFRLPLDLSSQYLSFNYTDTGMKAILKMLIHASLKR